MDERLKVQVWIYWQGPNQRDFPQVLMLKLKPKRGGFWQPVTGGVDPGEAIERAALREATEETALKFRSAPQSLNYSFSFVKEWDGKPFRNIEHAFALEVPSEPGEIAPPAPTIDPHEHVDWRWVSITEALGLLHFDSNRETLRLLKTTLERKTPHG